MIIGLLVRAFGSTNKEGIVEILLEITLAVHYDIEGYQNCPTHINKNLRWNKNNSKHRNIKQIVAYSDEQ